MIASWPLKTRRPLEYEPSTARSPVDVYVKDSSDSAKFHRMLARMNVLISSSVIPTSKRGYTIMALVREHVEYSLPPSMISRL